MVRQRTSLNVSLTPELERLITARVASGCSQTASEVVRAGLGLLEKREPRADWLTGHDVEASSRPGHT